MRVTNFGGHSGCRVFLCEEDNQVFVRKISGTRDYNLRLIRQADKQKNFRGGEIKTPKILRTGFTEQSLFYFDMEYIQGITLAEYLKTVEVSRVRGLVETLIQNIRAFGAKAGVSGEEVFVGKIRSLKEQLRKLGNPTVEKALTLLSRHSWNFFQKSFCHGDLTFQNIIVRDYQLYFIDFLDSFYDCWLLDVSTLLQDAQTLWSYRFQRNLDVNAVIRLILFRDILLDEVGKIGENAVREVYFALLLKLIRAYPYVKEKETYDFLNRKVELVLTLLQRGSVLK